MKFKELGAKIHSFYKRSDRFVHLLVGLPSYDKYVEHMKRHHQTKHQKVKKNFLKKPLTKNTAQMAQNAVKSSCASLARTKAFKQKI